MICKCLQMRCVITCVGLLIVRNVNGLPLEGNNLSLGDLMKQLYGPPPNIREHSVTDKPPVPQKDIEAIFGIPPFVIESEEHIINNQDNLTHDHIDIDIDILKSIWPDYIPEQDEPGRQVHQEGFISSSPPISTRQFAGSSEHSIDTGTTAVYEIRFKTPEIPNYANETPKHPNASCKCVLSAFLVVIVISLCILSPL